MFSLRLKKCTFSLKKKKSKKKLPSLIIVFMGPYFEPVCLPHPGALLYWHCIGAMDEVKIPPSMIKLDLQLNNPG
jgi:hypothetical protein